MRHRALAIAWIALPVLFVIALAWELKWWRTLVGRSGQVRVELAGVEREIKANEAEMVREMGALAEILREMQRWSIERGDPATFLTGLGQLVEGARLKITAIGPLERETAPQFRKSWHKVEVIAPYEELRELAARLEREGGILEDVSLRPPKERGRPGTDKANEVEARFRLATVELTPESKAILRRALAMSSGVPPAPIEPDRALALPLPQDSQKPRPSLRDPFAFAMAVEAPGAVRVARTEKASATTPANGSATPKPLPRIDVKGIVSFPGGYLAIVNDQIVKVGNQVDGHRVERIDDSEVVLRAPDGSPRAVRLPSITAASPTKPAM
jgi:hypothetical protein